MAFKSLKEFSSSVDSGNQQIFTFRKLPNQVTIGASWFDLSMSPGNPVPNYYAATPLVSVLLKQSTDGGIFHGSNVSPADKYISRFTLITNSATGMPLPFILCDYLMYYPFVDEGNTDEQMLTNSSSLSRYTDGEGVRIMVVSVAARTGGQQFIIKYTNSNGVANRVTNVMFQNSATLNGSIISSQSLFIGTSTPFVSLQAGDTGVRSVESVTMLGADVGLFTIVLVKPLIQSTLIEITAPVEVSPLIDKGFVMPKVYDDAYLNLICMPNGSLSGVTLQGDVQYTWK